MAIKCCGVDRNTNFCSECGAALVDKNPLVSLLAHCRKTFDAQKALYESHKRYQETLADDEVRKKRGERRLRNMQRNCNKWEGWGNALAALMVKAGEP